MKPKNVLVIGGGIAGTALALFLRKAGIGVEIFEARSEPASYEGLFLNLASNGMHVLGELGLAGEVARAGHRCPWMVMWNGDGKRLGVVPNGRPGAERPGEQGFPASDGPASVVVRRAELQEILTREAKRLGIPVHYGRRLVEIHAGDGGRKSAGARFAAVEARFADGSSALGDLLVGCDGIHSRVRELMDPSLPRPRYIGQLSCGGFSHAEATVPAMAPTPDMQHFVFGKRAFFGYLVRESGDVYWFANLDRPDAPRRSELKRIPAEEWQRELCALFKGDLPFIASLIRATRGKIGCYPIYEMPPLPRWHRGRIVLIGDAAHATSPSAGQGASMALEDALVLAKCLRDLPVDKALTAFESLRKDRAERIVRYSRARGSGKIAANALARMIRDAVMPIVLKRVAASSAHDWVYAFRETWSGRLA